MVVISEGGVNVRWQMSFIQSMQGDYSIGSSEKLLHRGQEREIEREDACGEGSGKDSRSKAYQEVGQ